MQTRRRFLASGAAVTGAAFLPRSRRGAGAEPLIVVVGAGLAGMTAAYRIYRRTGITPYVYEASDRIGGRTRTHRGLANDQYCEAGGTFISSGDRAIRDLTVELGLGLIDLNVHWPRGKRTLFFKDQERTGTQVFKDHDATARVARKQFDDLDWPVTRASHTSAAEVWDRVSIADWIEEFTPRGLDSLYGHYLRTYFESEYAGAVEDASSLHLIANFAAPGRNYDERFVVHGGSDRIVRSLRKRLLDGTVVGGTSLTRLARSGPGCTCTFATGSGELEVEADHVVLALPFTALRDVDYSGAAFSEAKDLAIRESRLGVNTKVNLQFENKAWSRERNGVAVTDLLTGWSWPGDAGQAGREAILVLFNGAQFAGTSDGSPAHGRASPEIVASHLDAVDRVFPGASNSFIEGGAYLDHWSADEWIRGRTRTTGSGGSPRSRETRGAGRDRSTSPASTPRVTATAER